MTTSALAGELYVVGTQHNIGIWEKAGVRNVDFAGSGSKPGFPQGWWMQEVTFDVTGTMWGVGTEQNVGRWTGTSWDRPNLGDWPIQQLVFGPDGTLWCLSNKERIGKWDGRAWVEQERAGWWLKQIAFDPDGNLWAVGTEHNVGKWNGKGWDSQDMGGWWVDQLLFTPDGTMWCVDANNHVGKWINKRWVDQKCNWTVVSLAWKPQQQPVDAAYENWSVRIADPGLASCLAYGTLWQSGDTTLYGYDLFNGRRTHVIGPFGAEARVRGVQPYDGGLLVYASDGSLYTASVVAREKPVELVSVDAEPVWMQAYRGSVYLASEKAGLQRVSPASEGSPARLSPAYGGGPLWSTPSIGDDFLLVPMKDGSVDAVDLAFNKLWSVKASPTELSAFFPTSFNGQYLCLATGPRSISVVSAGTQEVAWKANFPADLSAQPACDQDYCYVALKNGQLIVLSIGNGDRKKTITLPGVYSYMIAADGMLYGRLDRSGYALPVDIPPAVFALDVATGSVVTAETSSPADLIAVDNQVFYYRTNKAITACRLADLARTFYAEATLMQEFDFPDGTVKTTKQTPMIQTEITVFAPNGAPQAMQEVRINAPETVVIEHDGTRQPIGPNLFAVTRTDGNGRVRLALPAGRLDSRAGFQEGLSCPGLILFTTFMDRGLRILFSPDAQLHDDLAKVTADHLTDAKDFNGQPVIQEDYRKDPQKMASIAGMVNASFTMVQTSKAKHNRARETRGSYLAEGCNEQAICCCPDGMYGCPIACDQAFAFDLQAGTFSYLD
ncbi:MAG: PQQ-binding-like beta-propeller repeat protein, partial [Alphaproteobacteria bacterium]|nr:PQQ-binding-like beta-propeller repeat protein [Alphaproteobacteria bacterium]